MRIYAFKHKRINSLISVDAPNVKVAKQKLVLMVKNTKDYTVLTPSKTGLLEFKPTFDCGAIKLPKGRTVIEKITTAEIVGKYLFKHVYDKKLLKSQECMHAVFLNRANHVIGHQEVSKGGLNYVNADFKLILNCALQCLASGVIISHNHPSGNLVPSQSDIRFTEEATKAFKLLNIDLTDHIIVTPNGGLYSFETEQTWMSK